jgi:hypothetical protein
MGINFDKKVCGRMMIGRCGSCAGLSLVRINSLSKPLLMPGWRQLAGAVQAADQKSTEAGITCTCTVVNWSKHSVRARSMYLFLEKPLIRCFYGEFDLYEVKICKNQPFIWKPLKSPLGVLIWTKLVKTDDLR